MKPNRKLAELIIRDLAQFSGQTFKYPDRLTQAEATQLEAWAKSNQSVVEAYLNKSHQENAAVRLYVDVVRHFQFEHRQDPTGEPVAWPAPTGDEARPAPDNPFGAKTAGDAAALLAWAETKPEYRAAYADKNHPQHAEYVAQTHQLREIIGPTPGAVDPRQVFDEAIGKPPAAPAGGEGLSKEARISKHGLSPQELLENANAMRDGTHAQARIREAQKHPGYLDPSQPEHAAAVAAVSAAYGAAFPEPAPAAPAGS